MAWEANLFTIPMISSGNLSGQQFRVMKFGTAANTGAFCTASTVKVLGILQNTPSTSGGDAASVMVLGVSKCLKSSTAAAITYGDNLVCTTDGGVKTAGTAVLDYHIGTALETMAAGTTGVIEVFLNHEGRGSSSA